MGKFAVIPQNAFNGLQLDAGVLLKRFNPANPVAPADEDIICATTGGIKPTCKPTYSDFGSDVDNVPANMKEFKHLDGWECSIATTSLGTTPELIRLALGCADIDGSDTTKIIPRADLKQTDFGDIWWVGDRADGGLVAIELKNALSTDGFALTTTKNGKGQIALTLTGHVSINAQKEVPMVFYSADPIKGAEFTLTQTLSHVQSSYIGGTVPAGNDFTTTLTADEGYTIANVIVTVASQDVTATAYDSETGVVAVSSVAGDVVIVATANEV